MLPVAYSDSQWYCSIYLPVRGFHLGKKEWWKINMNLGVWVSSEHHPLVMSDIVTNVTGIKVTQTTYAPEGHFKINNHFKIWGNSELDIWMY